MLAREAKANKAEEGARFELEALVVSKCGIISPRSLHMICADLRKKRVRFW
jgi:hypothetical protein